eukprot:2102758-Lingulodinium_polyedra.AAC.1
MLRNGRPQGQRACAPRVAPGALQGRLGPRGISSQRLGLALPRGDRSGWWRGRLLHGGNGLRPDGWRNRR